MAKITLSGFDFPSFTSPQFLYSMVGEGYNANTLDLNLSLADIENHLGDELFNEDESSLTILDIFKAYIRALSTKTVGDELVTDIELLESLEKSIGKVSRYTVKGQDTVVTTFKSSAIFCNDKGLYFQHGDLVIPLEFVEENKSKKTGTWIIPGIDCFSQFFDTVDRENQGSKTKSAYLNLKIEVGENNDTVIIAIPFVLGLPDKDQRKGDKGNTRAATQLEKLIIRKDSDFSFCVLAPSSFTGFKTDLSILFEDYEDLFATLGKPFMFVLPVTNFEINPVKDQNFNECICSIDWSVFPDGLILKALDFNSGMGKRVKASELGKLQMPDAQISKLLKSKGVVRPTVDKPWYIHITAAATRKNPKHTVWDRLLDKCPLDLQNCLTACKTIAYYGGQTTIDEITQLNDQEVEAEEIDLSDLLATPEGVTLEADELAI